MRFEPAAKSSVAYYLRFGLGLDYRVSLVVLLLTYGLMATLLFFAKGPWSLLTGDVVTSGFLWILTVALLTREWRAMTTGLAQILSVRSASSGRARVELKEAFSDLEEYGTHRRIFINSAFRKGNIDYISVVLAFIVIVLETADRATYYHLTFGNWTMCFTHLWKDAIPLHPVLM
ncbi:MAG: hypothetical protein HXY34_13775, partial [Candidatus Thorarchaeota archaeon]|nr:hypothetical protein [Candidatus Thorarchaeota archaeon]